MEAVIDRLGEIGRSAIEKRTDGDPCTDPYKFTRVGEADLWKKLLDRDVKLELDDAKPDEKLELTDDEFVNDEP